MKSRSVEIMVGKKNIERLFFFFQAEDGIRDVRTWLEFRRVLFRSQYDGPSYCSQCTAFLNCHMSKQLKMDLRAALLPVCQVPYFSSYHWDSSHRSHIYYMELGLKLSTFVWGQYFSSLTQIYHISLLLTNTWGALHAVHDPILTFSLIPAGFRCKFHAGAPQDFFCF